MPKIMMTSEETIEQPVVEEVKVSPVKTPTLVDEAPAAFEFGFDFETKELEDAWQKVAEQVEKSLDIADEQDPEREAAHWDQIEKWLLKGYQRQAKTLALKVARLEFMMQAMTQNIETGLGQSFTSWSQHFDGRLNDMINRSIARQVERLVTIEVGHQTQVIADGVMHQLQARMNEIITAQVGAKTTNLAGEITSSVLANVNTHIGTLVESQVQKVQHQVSATVMKDVTQLITKVVSESLAAHTFDVDMDSINRRINHCLQSIAKLETDLYVRINHGDTQLYNWALKELLALRGCLTDREVLVEQLTAFVSALQGKLDKAPGADTRGIGPWQGTPVVSRHADGDGQGAATTTAPAPKTKLATKPETKQPAAEHKDDGQQQLLTELRDYLKQHEGVHSATEIAHGIHKPEEDVQKALDQLKGQGELGEWNGGYGKPDAVSGLKTVGDAALEFLKAHAGLHTAAEVAQGINKSADEAQQALNQLLQHGDVVVEHGRYGTAESVAAWHKLLGEVTDHLQKSDGLQTADQLAKATGKSHDEVQQALDQLKDEKKVADENGRYGKPEQVQAAKELAKRIADRLALTQTLDTVADLAKAVEEPAGKVQTALDQLKSQGKASDWNGRYGTTAEVDQLRHLGTAILDHLKAADGLETAADVAKALKQPQKHVQEALDQLEAQKQVGQWDKRYGLPEEVQELTELGTAIVAHLQTTGLQSASELAKALSKPADQVQAALDQLKSQNKVSDWHGRYDTPDAVEAVRALGDKILAQLPKTTTLDTAAELAKALGTSENSVQGALDELKTQSSVKVYNGRYGTADEVAKQIAWDRQFPMVTTLAGSGNRAYANGRGDAASFSCPHGVAVDSAGVVYVADLQNNRIRRVSPDGTVTTLAGSGQAGYADGRGEAAMLKHPTGVAVDAQGVVYVAGQHNHRILRISPDGEVTTLAGSKQGYADGRGEGARFNYPYGIAVDVSGTVFVADFFNNRIRKISPDGVVTTLAGSGKAGYADGRGKEASFNNPTDVVVNAAGMILVADYRNFCIRKISPDGVVTTLAGSRKLGWTDGPSETARFDWPLGLATDASGVVYVADFYRIRRISPDGEVTTVAGSGARAYANGRGKAASFNCASGVAVTGSGVVYVADMGNNRIRKLVWDSAEV